MAKGGRKNIPRSAIKEEQGKFSVRADKKDVEILGLVSEEIGSNAKVLKLNPYVALKYFESNWQCFSDWEKQELREFSGFLSSLGNHTWEQVYGSGNRTPKHGLAYTKYKISDVKSEAIKSRLKSVADKISEDISFFELRVNQNKLRVHGFQSHAVFFLVALDRNHEAFPM